jgi:hypothetical protein
MVRSYLFHGGIKGHTSSIAAQILLMKEGVRIFVFPFDLRHAERDF